MVIFSPQLLLCTSQIFRHGNNITLSLDMVYLELLNNAFKALNLILNKYVAVYIHTRICIVVKSVLFMEKHFLTLNEIIVATCTKYY
jgi:hypothetical protein